MEEEQFPSLLIKSFLSELNKEEQIKLDSWIKESDENSRSYSRIRAAWERSRSIENEAFPVVEMALDSVKQKVKGASLKRAKMTLSPLLKIAALIVLIMALGAALFKIRDARLPDIQTYASGNNPVYIVLPDSTAIWLGRNSTLQCPEFFNGRKRELVLEGLAYFDVKENKELPFVVKTGRVYTEVLGTTFTVECFDSGDVEVILETGRVSMYKNRLLKIGVDLSPGDKGSYAINGKSLHRSTNENPNYLSWKTRELRFYDTPLHKLCSELSKCYGIQVGADQNEEDLRFTGSFREESLEEVVRIIELTLDTRIHVENPR